MTASESVYVFNVSDFKVPLYSRICTLRACESDSRTRIKQLNNFSKISIRFSKMAPSAPNFGRFASKILLPTPNLWGAYLVVSGHWWRTAPSPCVPASDMIFLCLGLPFWLRSPQTTSELNLPPGTQNIATRTPL